MTDEMNVTDEGPLPLPRREEAQLESLIDNTNMAETDAESLRAITRLLVGGALVGREELLSHLQAWQEQIESARAQEGNVVDISPQDPATTLRYAMIGLLFESQDRWVRRSKKAFNLARQVTETIWSPFLNRAGNNRQLEPARNQYNKLVRRGEDIASRWVQRGRNEETISRQLTLTAVQESFDSSMDQLGKAPALEQLIRDQSVGITESVVDEGRARTITGDIVAEQFARRIFRRVPRSELQEPHPADEIDSDATETG